MGRVAAKMVPRSGTIEDAQTSGDGPTVFVAGATGRTGMRVVRELLSVPGLSVKAGCRDNAKFRETFGDQIATSGDRLNPVVNFDVTKSSPSQLASALEGVDTVVCCIGAPENSLNPSNPRLIDGEGVCRLVEAAKQCSKAPHFVLVSSLGTGKFGWPAAILNVFFGVLDWKRRSEEALVASGLPFTIVRPGGMEKPDDEYHKAHDVRISEADTQFGGQVSRLQVAWIVREAVMHRESAANKFLEATTVERKEEKVADETEETSRSILEGIEKISSLGPMHEGSPAWYTTKKYPYKPSLVESYLGEIGFGGMGPELINGRMAMLGVASMLGYEAVAKQGLQTQVQDGGTLVFTLCVIAAFTFATAVPLAKQVTPKDAQIPVFSAVAEKLNGRLAMLAFAFFVWKESTSNELSTEFTGSLFRNILPHLNFGFFDAKLVLAAISLMFLTVLSSFVPFTLVGLGQEQGAVVDLDERTK